MSDQPCLTLDVEQLAAALGISVRSIDRMERAGAFPIPRLFGSGKFSPRRYSPLQVQQFIDAGGFAAYGIRRSSSASLRIVDRASDHVHASSGRKKAQR